MSQTLQDAVEGFLAACGRPVLLEPGEEPIALESGSFLLESAGGRLRLQAWDRTRNHVRHLTGIAHNAPGRLELRVQRFGTRTGTIVILDQARPRNALLGRKAARLVLRERLRRMLRRGFPGWRIESLSAEADLENSLSPAYARAMVRKGATAWAALIAPDEEAAAHHALSFGLIWLDYLRSRERCLLVEGLALFLPAGRETASCLRLRCLHPRAARFAVYTYDAQECEHQVDGSRHGNLDTRLEAAPCAAAGPRLRKAPLPPEAELEQRIRANIRAIDATLLEQPVYGQVPAVAGRDRGIIDLLAADHHGRLAVVELKTSSDLHLPLQALDYWMRVDWHQRNGEFTERGYFPGHSLCRQPPRLLLVAPALQFHPTTETILRYFSDRIEVERVGLTLEWKKELAVMFRLRGSLAPH